MGLAPTSSVYETGASLLMLGRRTERRNERLEYWNDLVACFQHSIPPSLRFSSGEWKCAPDLHWVTRFCRPMARLFTLRTIEIGETRGIRTHHYGFHRAGCCYYNMVSIEEMFRWFPRFFGKGKMPLLRSENGPPPR